MPYIPPDRKWYIAELVMQFDIHDEVAALVHVNTTLIKADSPDHAFTRAEQLGRESEMEYENTDHERVRVTYRGLRDLFLIYDELEDGAELLYEELSDVNEDAIAAMVKDRSELAVFSES